MDSTASGLYPSPTPVYPGQRRPLCRFLPTPTSDLDLLRDLLQLLLAVRGSRGREPRHHEPVKDSKVGAQAGAHGRHLRLAPWLLQHLLDGKVEEEGVGELGGQAVDELPAICTSGRGSGRGWGGRWGTIEDSDWSGALRRARMGCAISAAPTPHPAGSPPLTCIHQQAVQPAGSPRAATRKNGVELVRVKSLFDEHLGWACDTSLEAGGTTFIGIRCPPRTCPPALAQRRRHCRHMPPRVSRCSPAAGTPRPWEAPEAARGCAPRRAWRWRPATGT